MATSTDDDLVSLHANVFLLVMNLTVNEIVPDWIRFHGTCQGS